MGQTRRQAQGEWQEIKARWAMSIYKRGEVYWYKFMWQGKLIREPTKQGNDKVARQMDAAHRTSLAQAEAGNRQTKPPPLLKDVRKGSVQPCAETRHAAKRLTLRDYTPGCDMLLRSSPAMLHLDELTDQHPHAFARA